MPVLNISTAIIHDPELFAEYVAKAAIIMADFDVTVVTRGIYIETSSGVDPGSHIMAVFRYPDLETAKAFFSSDAYQTLLALRDRACDMTIRFYDEGV